MRSLKITLKVVSSTLSQKYKQLYLSEVFDVEYVMEAVCVTLSPAELKPVQPVIQLESVFGSVCLFIVH